MSQVWAVTVVANEEDIIGYTISHLFSQGIDGVMVGNHGSTDRTVDILWEMKERYRDVVILPIPESAFYQGRFMTALANRAHEEFNAEWIVPFDADELFYCFNKSARFADALRAIDRPEVTCIGVPMFNHFQTSKDAESDNPFKRLVWMHPDHNPLGKIIYRWSDNAVIDEGHHGLTRGGWRQLGEPWGIGIRHFSARDVDRWIAKVVLAGHTLAMTDLPKDCGAHVRMYAETFDKHGAEALKEHYYRYFFYRDPDKDMIYDPAPYTGDL